MNFGRVVVNVAILDDRSIFLVVLAFFLFLPLKFFQIRLAFFCS